MSKFRLVKLSFVERTESVKAGSFLTLSAEEYEHDILAPPMSVLQWKEGPLMVGSGYLWPGRLYERLHISNPSICTACP